MKKIEDIITYQTNTWPAYQEMETTTNDYIAGFLEHIYKKGNMTEVLIIMEKFHQCGGVGHVVLISICSLIDSISAYYTGGGKVGYRFTGYISKYFPTNYAGKEDDIYKAFRCDGVHGWNLHKSSISGVPNDGEHLTIYENKVIHLSLYDFFNDLIKSFDKYLAELRVDDNLKKNFLKRYKEIRDIQEA